MINQYLLVCKIGTGYFSKVYLALNEDEKKQSIEENKPKNYFYAAKAINVQDNSITSSSFEREIQLLRKFNHPNIIKLHKVLYVPSKNKVYLIMEWANCGTLQNLINNKIKFDERTIASIFIQIALALSYIHSNGIIHRDVKPSNILLFSDGTAKISDFGISHTYESAESVAGTPAYQAPDLFDEDSESFSSFENQNSIQKDDKKDTTKLAQKKENNKKEITIKNNDENIINEQSTKTVNSNILFGCSKSKEINDNILCKEKKKIDPKKSDVWSLGITMFQTAFGVLPYNGKNIYEIINSIKTSTLVIPENNGIEYSPLFLDLIDKMLKKKSSERLSMNDVIQHPFFVRYELDLPENNVESDPNFIMITNKRVMQKVKFDIKPFQPPESSNSQVVKIDAIICPDNYSFAAATNSVSCPSYRFSFI